MKANHLKNSCPNNSPAVHLSSGIHFNILLINPRKTSFSVPAKRLSNNSRDTLLGIGASSWAIQFPISIISALSK